MKELGAPKIKAVWAEGCGAWCAIEGTHRIMAAKDLGIVPEIIEVEWSDEVTVSDCGCDIEDDCTIERVVDEAYKSTMISFDA